MGEKKRRAGSGELARRTPRNVASAAWDVPERSVDGESGSRQIGAIGSCGPPVPVLAATVVDEAEDTFVVELTVRVLRVAEAPDLARISGQQMRLVPCAEPVHGTCSSNTVIPRTRRSA